MQTEELEQETLAIQSLKTVLEKAPEHPFANYDLAIIYHNEGDRTNALAYYEKAAMVNPELKTMVNDQAFAIAQEEMEDTIYEEEQVEQSEEVEMVKEIEETVVEEESLAAKLVDTNPLVTSEIATPPPVVSEAPDAFEFPFKESNHSETIEPTSEEITDEEEVEIPPVKENTKIALITGATSGIGKATAIKLAQEGYQLILTGRRFSRLFQLKDQFEKDYEAKVRLLPFDIKDANAVQAALAELEEEWQSIDILINNAGLAKGETAIHEGELGHWDLSLIHI